MRSTYFLLGPPTPPVAVHDDSGHEDLRGCQGVVEKPPWVDFLRKIPAKTRHVFEVPIKSRVVMLPGPLEKYKSPSRGSSHGNRTHLRCEEKKQWDLCDRFLVFRHPVNGVLLIFFGRNKELELLHEKSGIWSSQPMASCSRTHQSPGHFWGWISLTSTRPTSSNQNYPRGLP